MAASSRVLAILQSRTLHLGCHSTLALGSLRLNFSTITCHRSTILAAKSSTPGSSSDEGEDVNEEMPDDLKWDMKADAQDFRDRLEKIVDDRDASFSGKDLATLIRKKYGRSYDVQMIRKEFMGKQLLAMNVMWKYREQRSFPLSEEEYILRLDDVANTLKYWGAVSVIRSSLEKTKERPRIGKAVSIFIDMDESGGRANEWMNR